MKIRYYKNSNVYFSIYEINGVVLEDLTDNVFSSIKELISWITQDEEIYGIIKDSNQRVLITMYRDKYDESNMHILDYTDIAVFEFDNTLSIKTILLGFRKTIDESISHAIYYVDNNILVYGDDQIDATEYFKSQCKDRELSDFILNNDLSDIFKY